MRTGRDAGEPFSGGQIDRRDAEHGALRDALFFAVFVTGAVLVNGILAILFIALMQEIGIWASLQEATEDLADSTRIPDIRLHLPRPLPPETA